MSRVEEFILRSLSSIASNEGETSRQLSAEGGGGVHIAYEDLYASIMFFAVIYVGGQFASRALLMPSLVGEIFAGIFLGPSLANYVPNPISFVMLGEIGLILLVIEAGIDIDLTTLQLIGPRGMLIAIVGSILPILFAFLIALAMKPTDIISAVAAGACFGPTSLGIAMNILRQGKIVNTPVGQLIVSAAVIDDMIALIILSQLGALAGEANVASIVIPIVSALAFLGLGGYIAVFILPKLMNKYFFTCVKKENHGAAGLAFMFLLLFVLMPATYYAKSSFLLGAFLSGLTFCTNHDVHVHFVKQFKRVLQWLMRIFFAASIGFQVPIKDFGSGTVIWQGLVFTLALTGKLLVGLMVPNFNNCEKYKGFHLRDCMITGFSMAAEGEFAFVIAVFAKDNYLITPDLYASIVLAVLISTILPPFALRFTMSHFSKVARKVVKKAGDLDCTRRRVILPGGSDELSPEDEEQHLRDQIEANKVIFLCIQIQCASSWGLTSKIISAVTSLGLEIIDNRSWHPRGADSTLTTEIFAQDDCFNQDADKDMNKSIADRLVQVNQSIFGSIRQPAAKVKVTRWFPGVLQGGGEVNEEGTSTMGKRQGSVKDMLALEASKTLENKQDYATGAKSLSEIKKATSQSSGSMSRMSREGSIKDLLAMEASTILEIESQRKFKDSAAVSKSMGDINNEFGGLGATPETGAPSTDRVAARRRARQKMRSTPVIGGSLFDEPETETSKKDQSVELVVGGEVFKIRVMPATIHRIRAGYSGELLDDSSIKFSSVDVPIEQRLGGYVRTNDLSTVDEDMSGIEY